MNVSLIYKGGILFFNAILLAMETRTEQQYENIVLEIARLSLAIFEGAAPDECKALALVINHLSGVLMNKMSISDFHDEIAESGASQIMRDYYYKLLF